ncbi:CDP-glycerol glycerophosphotransferase family protein [Pseudaminobacter sp. 19-2017]|uniref:CDP-glycerol glycerophosphotransferase family protein n=1 Tax=Pseudaminobacter soli (ex Zhang et al. 2022) TaxID=2831468 RepID=A0A942E3J0_9HYPH|nr:CDP-glycerol glycerophosphotransferase family protein [Pseudaminobacter soli]MBS3650425.1 CDP-glycerol glycerophosphotransferase family protein [Pseudaminobacter soli]
MNSDTSGSARVVSPLLSVVIPFHNVAQLLPDSVSSVLNQRYKNLDVILVNDGSTDGSLAVAEQFAAKDDRIRIVTIDNSGPGRARNVGTDLAKGEFIAYVDSDDVITGDAHHLLMDSLLISGSDFATGGVRRWRNGQLQQSTIHDRAIRATVQSTTIHLSPQLIYDITFWNKVFRTSFIREEVGRFPEGMLYEDIQPINRAYLRARSVDVIADVIYYWRVRNDNSSITQSREQISTLQDRCRAILSTRSEYEENANYRTLLNDFDVKTLTIDFPIYLRVCAKLSAEYRDVLFSELKKVLTSVNQELVFPRLPVVWRSVYHLLLEDRRESVERVLSISSNPETLLQTKQVGGRFYATLPLSASGEETTGPLFDATESLRKVIRKTGHWTLPEGGIFSFSAHIDRVNLSNPSSCEIRVWANVRDGDIRVPIEVTRVFRKELVAKSPFAHDYSWGGFQFRIDFRSLNSFVGGKDCIFDLHFSMTIGEYTWTDRLPFKYRPTALRAFLRRLMSPKGRFYSTADQKLAVAIQNQSLGKTVRQAVRQSANWFQSVGRSPKKDVPTDVSPRKFGITSDQDGNGVTSREIRIEEIRFLGTSLRAKFRTSVDGARLSMTPKEGGQEFLFDVEKQAECLVAHLDLTSVERAPGVVAPLPTGEYLICAFDQAGSTLRCSIASTEKLQLKKGELSFELVQTQEGMRLKVRAALPPHESGKDNQARLEHAVYGSTRSQPVRPLILFDSWGGKRIDDHPKAIHDALAGMTSGYELVFVARDATVPVPVNVNTVRKFSTAFYAALGEAAALVINNDLPRQFKRREGQIVLQTWHGTPLKKIGFDISEVQFFNKNYLAELPAQVANWDALLSPSDYVSQLFRSAFRFGGEFVEVGSPRIDMLSRPDAVLERARLRRLFSIPDQSTVALYAPTWRDNQYSTSGKYRFDQALDLEHLCEKHPHCYFLVRRHHQISVPLITSNNPRLIEVSYYPNITDLYAMSDLLITDYSSTMVDFSVTRKPMICYAPDIDEYRDNLRGFYIDFENEIPCPIARTKEEVSAILEDISASMQAYSERYAHWIRRYVVNEDGNASRRAAEWLLDRLQ